MRLKMKPNLNEMKRKGSLIIDKGKSSDLEICSFDGIIECNKEECPIYKSCPYPKSGKCKIRKHYLNHCLKILNQVPSKLDKLASMKIGFNILPLYSQLIGFKILAHSLSLVSDGKKINPVFKEIREVIKLISVLLRDLEPKEKVNEAVGTSDYYDSLFSVEKPQEKVFKRKFLKMNKKF